MFDIAKQYLGEDSDSDSDFEVVDLDGLRACPHPAAFQDVDLHSGVLHDPREEYLDSRPCVIELVSEDWLSTGTLQVDYTDAFGRRQAFTGSGSHVKCHLTAAARNVDITFRDSVTGSQLCAVDREDPASPWVVGDDGEFAAETFRYQRCPLHARYYLRGFALAGVYISRIEVSEQRGRQQRSRSGAGHDGGKVGQALSEFSRLAAGAPLARRHAQTGNLSSRWSRLARRAPQRPGTDSDGESKSSGTSAFSREDEQEDDEDISHDQGTTPSRARRRCTDGRWLLVFLAANALLAYVVFLGTRPCVGRMFSWLEDYKNNPCDWGANIGKRYLFFCEAQPGVLDPYNPICIDVCPQNVETSHECFVGNETGGQLVSLPDYPTEAVWGIAWNGEVCRPKEDLEWVSHRSSSSNNLTERRFVLLFLETTRCWKPLAACVLMSLIVSHLYLTLLRYNAGCLLWASLVTLICGLWGWALFASWREHNQFLATLVFTSGLALACFAWRQEVIINRANICVELACKCVLDMPMLKFSPIFCVLARSAAGISSCLALSMFLRCGLKKSRSEVVFELSVGERLCIGYILFMFVWSQMFISACWQFCLAYATELWYFKGLRKKSALFGFSTVPVMARYHLGTLAVGGFVVGFSKPLRFVMGLLSVGARVRGFPANGLMQCLCAGLADFYDDRLDFLSKRAYMDVALNSASFFPAARHSLAVTAREVDTIRAVHGASWVFQVVGLLLVFVLARWLAHLMLFGDLNTTHMSSLWHGESARTTLLEVQTVLCAVCASFVAWPFMVVFDLVSDTILYCVTVEQMRKEELGGHSAAQAVRGYFSFAMEMVSDSLAALQEGCGGSRPGHSQASDCEHGDAEEQFSVQASSAGSRSASKSSVLSDPAVGLRKQNARMQNSSRPKAHRKRQR